MYFDFVLITNLIVGDRGWEFLFSFFDFHEWLEIFFKFFRSLIEIWKIKSLYIYYKMGSEAAFYFSAILDCSTCLISLIQYSGSLAHSLVKLRGNSWLLNIHTFLEMARGVLSYFAADFQQNCTPSMKFVDLHSSAGFANLDYYLQ